MNISCDYIEPEARPAAWSAMAADLHAQGHSHAQIAESLCVDEDTVWRLLALAKEAA